MANIIGCNYTQIVSGELGNKDAASCCGVPGQDLAPAYIYANFGLKLAVDTNHNVYASPSGGYVTQTGMINTGGGEDLSWRVYLIAGASAWTQTFDGDWWQAQASDASFYNAVWLTQTGTGLTGRTDFPSVADPTTDADALAKGFKKLPWTLDQLEQTTTEEGGVQTITGKCHLLCPVLYAAWPTDPITLSSMSFDVDITNLLSYYPGAIRKSGKWMGCNRNGGGAFIRKSSSWRDVRNIPSESPENDGLIRKSGKWVRAQRIGEE